MEEDQSFLREEDENITENSLYGKKNKKAASSKETVKLEEEVVYNLILSLHIFTSTDYINENSLETEIYSNKLQILEKNGIKRADIDSIIQNKIKPISYSLINDIRMKIRCSLKKIYLNKKNEEKEEEIESNQSNSSNETFTESVYAYIALSALLRQNSIPTPIQEGFYEEYSFVWSKLIENIKITNKNFELVEIEKNKMLKIWTIIPHQSLDKHLEKFELKKPFAEINESKEQISLFSRILRHFTTLLIDNKIQQCCIYYETFYKNKYKINENNIKISIEIEEFEDKVLIPKITKSDHIFSSHVLSLLKENYQLKERLLNSIELDPAVGVRVIDLLKLDGKNYDKIYRYCLRQHYKSVVFDHIHWWIVEDKLSFNKNFILWYTEDLEKATENISKNKNLEKIVKQIENIGNIDNILLSILERNGLIEHDNPKIKKSEFKRVLNPLYQMDKFDCAELIVEQMIAKEKETCKYLRFEEYGVNEKEIRIIDKIDEEFHSMCKILLSKTNEPIGFDTEFRCASTKYDQQGVSLIQLSTENHHYIIDFLNLEAEPLFSQFIVELFCNEEYIKVGHTISSDIRYLRLTLHIPENKPIQSFFDITQMFKSLYPDERLSSLSFLCLKFLNRKMSKYEQRSNWNRRPLKKTQIHYAAMDAFACILIYNKILPDYLELVKRNKTVVYKQENLDIKLDEKTISEISEMGEKEIKEEELTEEEQKLKESETNEEGNYEYNAFVKDDTLFVGDTYRSDRLTYHKKYEDWIFVKEPEFLVDNMLKKLSAIMRNCGLNAEFIAVRDYNLAKAIAEKEKRIILTRDNKFFQQKDNRVPVYMIKEKRDSDRMFEEIRGFFNIDLSKFQTLSRCVKCNGPELSLISKDQAMNFIKWKYEDSNVNEFWICTKCKQIYWEGNMFQKAKSKYSNLKNKELTYK